MNNENQKNGLPSPFAKFNEISEKIKEKINSSIYGDNFNLTNIKAIKDSHEVMNINNHVNIKELKNPVNLEDAKFLKDVNDRKVPHSTELLDLINTKDSKFAKKDKNPNKRQFSINKKNLVGHSFVEQNSINSHINSMKNGQQTFTRSAQSKGPTILKSGLHLKNFNKGKIFSINSKLISKEKLYK